MKKIYVEAELEIIELMNADIITASGNNGGGTIPDDHGGSWGGYY